MRSKKVRFLLLAIFTASLTVALDRIVFDGFIFRIEHRGSWDEFRWFTFEYHFRHLLRDGSCSSDEKPCVLVVGSSIAKYSIQKDLLEREIERAYGSPVNVELLVHASMLPVDLIYYLKRARPLHPDLVLYVTNPADLDLARYTPPWEAGPEYSPVSTLHYLKDRIPPSLYYPASFALERMGELDLDYLAGRFLRASLDAFRFKGEWYEPVKLSFRSGSGNLRSYLNYQGESLPDGLWREGNTGGCVRFPERYLKKGKFLFQVLESQKKVKDFTIQFYKTKEPEVALESCRVPEGSRFLLEWKPKRYGWQSVDLSRFSPANWIFVRMTHVEKTRGVSSRIKPSEPLYSGRGIRLPGDFGLDTPVSGNYLVRYRSLEDDRIGAMDISDYRKDYNSRIQPDDWRDPANSFLWQMNEMRMGKYITLWSEFSPDLVQAKALQRFVEENLPGTSFLLINNPENPIALDDYGGTEWYDSYLAFLQEQETNHPGQVFFRDFHDRGREQDFIDPHHLTYDGMVKMMPLYARAVTESLQQIRQRASNPYSD